MAALMLSVIHGFSIIFRLLTLGFVSLHVESRALWKMFVNSVKSDGVVIEHRSCWSLVTNSFVFLLENS